MKALIKYLSICILLLSGNNALHAHTNQNYTHHLVVNIGFKAIYNNQTSIVNVISSNKEKENDELNALVIYDDDDDDESISFKKYLEDSSSYSASNFFSQTSEYFFNYNKKLLPFHKCFPSISSYKYLVFQVFRV